MKERPIIFSGPMVKAILEGRKTMTRRICKKAWDGHSWAGAVHPARDEGWISRWPGGELATAEFTKKAYNKGWLCPYGVPGDRLWVRETWDFLPDGQNSANIFYWVDGDFQQRIPPPEYNPFLYNNPRKRPSIHMPRWASRITLEITAVRVERVQEITPQDCEGEGIDGVTLGSPVRGQPYEQYMNGDGLIYGEPRDAFESLWESIHGPGSWEQNPWVWVLEFKRIQP